jgi:hypothetical protein
MRDLVRNQQHLYYALLSVEKTEDEWGNKKDVKSYGKPVGMRMSVSPNKGEATAQAFGADLQYDREMVTHNMDCPIDEYSHLWIDGRSPEETHNYEVAAVSKSLNCIRYAIKKVNLSR